MAERKKKSQEEKELKKIEEQAARATMIEERKAEKER